MGSSPTITQAIEVATQQVRELLRHKGDALPVDLEHARFIQAKVLDSLDLIEVVSRNLETTSNTLVQVLI